jgi:hypothetical protein
MILFAEDILAGIMIIVAIILFIVALLAYRRYGLKAALVSAIVFAIFLAKGIIYELNIYYSLNLDIITIFLGLDVIVLISLYFALALRG